MWMWSGGRKLGPFERKPRFRAVYKERGIVISIVDGWRNNIDRDVIPHDIGNINLRYRYVLSFSPSTPMSLPGCPILTLLAPHHHHAFLIEQTHHHHPKVPLNILLDSPEASVVPARLGLSFPYHQTGPKPSMMH